MPYIFMYFLKNAWLLTILFWIPVALDKICFFRIVINCMQIPLYKKVPSLNDVSNSSSHKESISVYCRKRKASLYLVIDGDESHIC